MSGKKSKNKGKLFEREIANFLSDLYGESFTRVPYSGAFVGGKNAVRKEHLDEAQIRGFKSDIIPPVEWSKLNIECKHYAEFPFHALLRPKDIPLLDQWIAQTYDAADDGDFNLIIMKFNRLGRFVMFEKEASLRKVGQQVHLATSYHYAYYKDWIMMDFDTFWLANKSLVKELSHSFVDVYKEIKIMFYEPSQKQWLFITDVFTPEECESISKYSESLPPEPGLTTGKQQQKARSSTIARLPINAESSWMYQRLVHTIEKTNPNTFQFEGLNIGEPVQFAQYVENDFYDWHIDAVPFPESPPVRKVSCSVLLTGSTEFDGGEMQVRAWNEETIKLEQGQGLFFASFLQHRVLPVTAGMRKSMVIWFNGPSFK